MRGVQSLTDDIGSSFKRHTVALLSSKLASKIVRSQEGMRSYHQGWKELVNAMCHLAFCPGCIFLLNSLGLISVN